MWNINFAETQVFTNKNTHLRSVDFDSKNLILIYTCGHRLWFTHALLHVIVHAFLQSVNSAPQCYNQRCTTYSALWNTFCATCHSNHVDPFNMFFHLLRSVDWSQCLLHQHAGCSPPSSYSSIIFVMLLTLHFQMSFTDVALLYHVTSLRQLLYI
jgi:hypothetical protein